MGVGPVAQAVLGKDNAISDVDRGDGAFVPFIFTWFQYLLTNRNNLLPIRNMSVSMEWCHLGHLQLLSRAVALMAEIEVIRKKRWLTRTE